ncbi:hypothetical protein [Phaeobacter sp. C3_T13_0]
MKNVTHVSDFTAWGNIGSKTQAVDEREASDCRVLRTVPEDDDVLAG